MLDKSKLLESQLNTKKKSPRPVQQSKATGIEYSAALRKLVREIRKDINAQLMPVLRDLQPQYQADTRIKTVDTYVDRITGILQAIRNKWTSAQFRIIADTMARSFITTADNVNSKRFDTTMRSVGVNVYADAPAITDYLAASIYDNVQLITSIPDKYLSQVESIVMTNVRAGARSSVIAPQLAKQFGITDRRAKMIARDQTAKVNGDLVKKRQTAVGFEFFQWMTSDDERVRDRHDELADRVTAYGKGIYRWDNPPISDDGRPIIPGQDYQCRCNARPVGRVEVDRNIKAGKTRPSVKR